MIINPIIPIWLMLIVAVVWIILIIYNKPIKKVDKKTVKEKKDKLHFAYLGVRVVIILLIFIINARPMIPEGEAMVPEVDVNILFVIDTSVSMRALDYRGNKERMEGVIKDCCYIVEKLENCKFSIITFGDMAKRTFPFTTDTLALEAELKALTTENDTYARGSSLNIVKNVLENTLKKEKERQKSDAKFMVFFISDGEITIEGETLESFESLEKYIDNGAVMGYGTENGGKMVSSAFANDPFSPYYYKYYYDDKSQKITAISKLDEANLKQLAKDLNIDYIHMEKQSNIQNKINEIQQSIYKAEDEEKPSVTYKDTYYYFAVPLLILLIVDLIIKKRRIK